MTLSTFKENAIYILPVSYMRIYFYLNVYMFVVP